MSVYNMHILRKEKEANYAIQLHFDLMYVIYLYTHFNELRPYRIHTSYHKNKYTSVLNFKSNSKQYVCICL